MKESDLKKVCSYPIYTRDSKTYTDRGFVDIDNGSMGRTQCVCSYTKDEQSN